MERNKATVYIMDVQKFFFFFLSWPTGVFTVSGNYS